MTRNLLAAALLLLSTAAAAEWKTVAESAIGRMSYDTTSVHPQGKHMQLRYRIDFTAVGAPQGERRPRSAVMDVTLDCPARTMGLVSFTSYAEPDGKGDVLGHQAFSAPKMEQVHASSTGVPLLKAACGEKTEPYPALAPGPGSAAPAPAAKPAPSGSAPATKK